MMLFISCVTMLLYHIKVSNGTYKLFLKHNNFMLFMKNTSLHNSQDFFSTIYLFIYQVLDEFKEHNGISGGVQPLYNFASKVREKERKREREREKEKEREREKVCERDTERERKREGEREKERGRDSVISNIYTYLCPSLLEVPIRCNNFSTA